LLLAPMKQSLIADLPIPKLGLDSPTTGRNFVMLMLRITLSRTRRGISCVPPEQLVAAQLGFLGLIAKPRPSTGTFWP
jgi:hypothetical protein